MKDKILYILKIVVNLALLFAVIFLLRYLGLKGVIGLFTGMMLMAYLLLSKNGLLMYFVKLFSGEWYIDELNKRKGVDSDESKKVN